MSIIFSRKLLERDDSANMAHLDKFVGFGSNSHTYTICKELHMVFSFRRKYSKSSFFPFIVVCFAIIKDTHKLWSPLSAALILSEYFPACQEAQIFNRRRRRRTGTNEWLWQTKRMKSAPLLTSSMLRPLCSCQRDGKTQSKQELSL